MKRRQVITGFMGLMAAAVVPPTSKPLSEISPTASAATDFAPPVFEPLADRERRPAATIPVNSHDIAEAQAVPISSLPGQPLAQGGATDAVASNAGTSGGNGVSAEKAAVVNKSIEFNRDDPDDLWVAQGDSPLLHSVQLKLKNLQKTVGFGNFNVISFDEALLYARRFSAIGEFSTPELAFIEKVFFTDAHHYGFYGEKTTDSLTASFKKGHIQKIPHSGHYLLKGDSLNYYNTLKQDVGDSIILTSGIRSNVKQLHLFLAKTVRVKGNLSRASRSLAPPGYSYHGIGDFDVGRIGWGAKNFTDDFASTDEFKRMQDLGYIAIRYDHGNQLGVRFEPWHIKVV